MKFTWSCLVNAASVKKLDDIAIVSVYERMDVLNAPVLVQQFNHLLDEGIVHFIVDLSDVRIADADGDYPLLHLLKCVQNIDGSLHLICPRENPIRVFYELMHLDILFDISFGLESHVRSSQSDPISTLQGVPGYGLFVQIS